MNLAIKISILASGLFLLSGMLTGRLKYQRTMTSAEHRAPVYVDIAHKASFLYSCFAALVIAKLLEYSPYSQRVQVFAAVVPLAFLLSRFWVTFRKASWTGRIIFNRGC